jgi:hypothetical protein
MFRRTAPEIGERAKPEPTDKLMFSHVVIFWTRADDPQAVNKLIAGAERYLKPIPGILHFHVGKMVPSPRPVVDQSFQVGLNIVFADKQAQDEYQAHPSHVQFVEQVLKPVLRRVAVFDFMDS